MVVRYYLLSKLYMKIYRVLYLTQLGKAQGKKEHTILVVHIKLFLFSIEFLSAYFSEH